ncbi:MAG: hypothetical protein ACKPJD_26430, partial [Planctomycetaceae bacterium]
MAASKDASLAVGEFSAAILKLTSVLQFDSFPLASTARSQSRWSPAAMGFAGVKLVVVMPEMLSTLPVGAEVRFMKTMYEAAPSTACHVMVGLAAAVVPATGEVIVG